METSPSPEAEDAAPTSSQKRIEANRRNSRRSTGPKSVAGKNAVRGNALKHGLTAEKLVVLGENAEAFRCMADAHLADLQPGNSIELELCNTFTLAAWRRRRCVFTEAAMTNQYIGDSARAEAAGRREHVLLLGARLFHDSQEFWQFYPDPVIRHGAARERRNRIPGGPDTPARLVAELESTYEGCKWLLKNWCQLRNRPPADSGWDAYDMFRCIRLLGKQPLDVVDDPPGELMDIFLICHKMNGVEGSPFGKLRSELNDKEYDLLLKRLERLHPEEREPIDRDHAVRMFEDFIERHIRRLERLVKKRKAQAKAEAAGRRLRLAFDPGEEADKVRRYEDASIRRMSRALDDLVKARRSGVLDDAGPLAAAEDLVRNNLPESPPSLREGTDLRGAKGDTYSRPAPKSETENPKSEVNPKSEIANPKSEPDAAAPNSVTTVALPSEPTLDGPRSTVHDHGALLNALLLVLCFGWLVAGGEWARLSGSPLTHSFRSPARGVDAPSPAEGAGVAAEQNSAPPTTNRLRESKPPDLAPVLPPWPVGCRSLDSPQHTRQVPPDRRTGTDIQRTCRAKQSQPQAVEAVAASRSQRDRPIMRQKQARRQRRAPRWRFGLV